MVPEKMTLLEQRMLFRGYQKFEVQADGELEITLKKFSTLRHFKIPLWQIISTSERLKFSQPGIVLGVWIFGACSLGTIVWMAVSQDWGVTGSLALPLVPFLLLFCTCFWKMKTQSIDAVVFHTRDGGQLHIWHEKPDSQSYQSFCKLLTERAKETWENRPADPSTQSLAAELAALKKLQDTGVLTDAEFEKAKSKVINSAEDRKIGFK